MTDASALETDGSALPAIVVSAQKLDDRRSRIQTQTGASTYTVDAAAIGDMPAGDNTNAQSGHPANARRRPGFLRSIPHPGRTQWAAISNQRRHPAGGDQRIRPSIGSAIHQFHEPDRRRSARGIWVAHGRHHRYHDQKRHPVSGRHRIRLWRKPWRDRAELRLWRRIRGLQLPDHRRFSAQ